MHQVVLHQLTEMRIRTQATALRVRDPLVPQVQPRQPHGILRKVGVCYRHC